MTIGLRLKKLRLERGLSQQGLANAISQLTNGKKISRASIAQWESGATKEIEAGNLIRVAAVFNVVPEWLLFGTGKMQSEVSYLDGLALTTINAKLLPFLQEGTAKIGIDPELAKVIGEKSFAILVKGNSMSPMLKPSDIVVIDPDVVPLPGEIVAVELPNESALILRKYRPLGKNTKGFNIIELIPLNEDWPRITVNNNNPGHIIGTLVEHRCRRRLQ